MSRGRSYAERREKPREQGIDSGGAKRGRGERDESEAWSEDETAGERRREWEEREVA